MSKKEAVVVDKIDRAVLKRRTQKPKNNKPLRVSIGELVKSK